MGAAAITKRETNIGQGSIERLHRDAKVDILCEDNLRFMRKLEDESMHLIVTSPPYNIGKEYESRKSQEIYIEEQAACIAEAVRLWRPMHVCSRHSYSDTSYVAAHNRDMADASWRQNLGGRRLPRHEREDFDRRLWPPSPRLSEGRRRRAQQEEIRPQIVRVIA